MRYLLQLVSGYVFISMTLLNFSRIDANARVNCSPAAAHQMYTTWADALAAYTVAYHAGDVKANPEPNSRFWTQPVPKFRVGDILSHTPEEDSMWAQFGDEDSAAREQLTKSFGKLKV